MGAKDIAEKTLEMYNDVFADIVNMKFFDGKQVVQPDSLEDAVATSQYKDDEGELHEQERDVAKYWKDGCIRIAFWGIENQTKVDEDMPIRCIGYDGAAYRNQMNADEWIADDETGKKHRKRNKRYPVVTLVLYFGNSKWNKPTNLYGMMDIPKALKPFVNDYKINLLEVAHLEEADLEKFHSDFRVVAEYYIKGRKDKNYKPDRRVIQHVDEVLKLMTVITGDARYVNYLSEVPKDERREVTMCEVMENAEQRGIAYGIKLGEERGIDIARVDGIKNLMKNMNLSADEAMTNLGIEAKDFEKYKAML